MRHLQSAVSIWLDGPVDGEDIASLSALMKDFEQELGIELCLEEPTRIRSRLSSSSMTYVDLRALIGLPPLLSLSDPDATRLYRLPWKGSPHEDLVDLDEDDPDEGAALRPTDSQVHLMVRRPTSNPASPPVSLVVSLSRLPDEGIVTRIAGALQQVLGPDCQVFQPSKTDEERISSGDECYLQTVEEIFQQYPPSVTGRWFAEGLAAERELVIGPGTGPLPVIYRDVLDEAEAGAQEQPDEDDPLQRHPGTRRVRWSLVVFLALLVLMGWSFVNPGTVLQWVDGLVLKAVEVLGKEAAPPKMELGLEHLTPVCPSSPSQSRETTNRGDELFRPGISGVPLCSRPDGVHR